jgi:hypothetical protein
MLTRRQIRSFEVNGFLHAPGVFTPEQIRQLRDFCARLFARKPEYEGDMDGTAMSVYGDPGRSHRLDVFARNPELSWVLVHPPLLATLRGLLGQDFVFLPETSAHASGYFGAWHKDTDAQEAGGATEHWRGDFRMVQVAIYLQDNTPEYGGGLDVIPGSHRRRGRAGQSVARSRLAAWLDRRLYGHVQGVACSVPTRAGDLVLFDFRMDHRPTSPASTPVPAEHRKYALFLACSARNRHADLYVRFISGRPDYCYLKTHHYPEALRRLASAEKLTLL